VGDQPRNGPDVNGLSQVVIDPHISSNVADFVLSIPRDGDDERSLEVLHSPAISSPLISVQVGQPDVEQEDIRAIGQRYLYPLGPS